MKKYFLLSILSMLIGFGNVVAQSAQKKPNELAKIALLKLQAEVTIDNNNIAKAYEAFENYYKSKATLTVSMPQSEIVQKDNQGGFDAINEKRNEALKTLLSTVQYTKWIQVAKTFTQSIVEVN
jgi:hypothetical protein